MKKLMAAFTAFILILSLAACTQRNETIHTLFFDFRVASAKLDDGYANLRAEDGYKLLDVVIAVTNTNPYESSIEMLVEDFQLQWGEYEANPDAFAYAVAPVEATMVPDSYMLVHGETTSYHYVFQVPEGWNEFLIAYRELVIKNGVQEENAIYYTSFTAS